MTTQFAQLKVVKNNKKKPWVITITILVIIFGGVFGFDLVRAMIMKKIFTNFKTPAQVVSAYVVKAQDWQPILPAVGEIQAYSGVDISPEMPGRVREIYFTPGQTVNAGDKLIQLDDSSESAQLKSVEAQLKNAELNLKRNENLLAQKAISQGAYDNAFAAYKEIKANYQNLAALKNKKLLKAPFSGKIGIAQVKVGQFVGVGQVCVSLQTIEALYISFAVSQKDFSHLSINQPVEVRVDSYPHQVFTGHISALDSEFNADTRTIDVQAALDPSNISLLPGMFADVNVLLPVEHNALVVPQTAITYTLYGESALVVTFDTEQKDGKTTTSTDKNGYQLGNVKRVFVKTGDKRDNFVVITEGLKNSDVVVDAGQSKIDDGSAVAISMK